MIKTNSSQHKDEKKIKLLDRWNYYFFGGGSTSIIQFKHEFYLWVSLSILCASSLQSLYRSSAFTQEGDLLYCGLTTLWLSRHLILRYIYTQDGSTLRSPTFFPGIFNHWLSSIVVAGQYFDRSDPHVVAKNVGVANVDINATTTTNNNKNSIESATDYAGGGSSIFSLPSISYTLQYIRVSFLDPLGIFSNAKGRFSRHRHFSKNTNELMEDLLDILLFKKARVRIAITYDFLRNLILSHTSLSVVIQRFMPYGPPLQLILSASVFAFCLFQFQNDYMTSHASTSARAIAGGLDMFALTMQPGGSGGSSRNDHYYTLRDTSGDYNIGSSSKGVYEPLQPPSWYRIFFLMSSVSTMLSILFYGRVSFPIPDLVTGTNVLKALRNETRKGTTTGKTKNSRMHHHNNSSNNKNYHDPYDSNRPWAEIYKSISGENRFRLSCKVILLRIIDALVCCVALPRTVLVCRATQHCPIHLTLSELSKIFYAAPGGGVSYESGSSSMFQTINPDRGSLFLNIVSVIIITSTLLLAQLVTLNKSYLSIMGHLACGWKRVTKDDIDDDDDDDYESEIIISSCQRYDPRRHYKKGDLIIVHNTASKIFLSSLFPPSLYRATCDSPEGRPFDFFFDLNSKIFTDEVGHTSTSTIILVCAKVQVAFMSLIVLFLFWYNLWMTYYDSTALLIILFANIVATYGLLSSGLLNHKELQTVAAEINNF